MNSQIKRIEKQQFRQHIALRRKLSLSVVRHRLFMHDKKNRRIRDREWRRTLSQMIDVHRSVKLKAKRQKDHQKKTGHKVS